MDSSPLYPHSLYAFGDVSIQVTNLGETDFIIEVCKAIGMKMLITVPQFGVKDKSVSQIRDEAVERLRYLSDRVGSDIRISLEFCGAPNCSINQFGTAYEVVKAKVL